MEGHTPHLIVAQSLVHESQQRHGREQPQEHLRVRARRGDRLRQIVAVALVRIGERVAGISPGEAMPAAATTPDPNVLTR